MREALGRIFFQYGWDTRCRNLIPAKTLRPLLSEAAGRGESPVLLDVGCGRRGVATFLRDVPVMGVDLEQEVDVAANFTFRPGSITSLPFADRSFPFVSCVDVLEHLPLETRPRAVDELVRVADCAVLIACPHGPTAERCDHEFVQTLVGRKRAVPDWLEEHLRQPYPTVSVVCDEVRRAAAATGRDVAIDVRYCEPEILCRAIRKGAARSPVLYAALNLALGAAMPLLPAPTAGDSYRCVLLATLGPRREVPREADDVSSTRA